MEGRESVRGESGYARGLGRDHDNFSGAVLVHVCRARVSFIGGSGSRWGDMVTASR